MQVNGSSSNVVFITWKSSKDEVGRENQRLRGGAPVGKHTVPLQRPGSQPRQAAQPGETIIFCTFALSWLRDRQYDKKT